jgi:hypothetical protein
MILIHNIVGKIAEIERQVVHNETMKLQYPIPTQIENATELVGGTRLLGIETQPDY